MEGLAKQVPAFGSDAYLRRCLLSGLSAARAAVDRAHREAAAANWPHADLDMYVYLRLPRRQRKVWRLLEEIAAEQPWVSLGNGGDVLELLPSVQVGNTAAKNAERPAAEAAAAELLALGVEARVEVRYR